VWRGTLFTWLPEDSVARACMNTAVDEAAVCAEHLLRDGGVPRACYIISVDSNSSARRYVNVGDLR